MVTRRSFLRSLVTSAVLAAPAVKLLSLLPKNTPPPQVVGTHPLMGEPWGELHKLRVQKGREFKLHVERQVLMGNTPLHIARRQFYLHEVHT